jgi:hypothetical protein
MANRFDELAKSMAQGVSRRQALKLFTTGLAGAVLAALTGKAEAAPQTCVVCVCGTGRPCNPKSNTCVVLRAFPAQTTCQQACAKQGQNLCSTGVAYHCPQGCP